MKTKHTPGPWTVAVNEDGTIETGRCFADQTTSVFSESGFGSVAAVIYKKSGILGDSKTLEEETFKANALLIAAAPELFEACRAIDVFFFDSEGEEMFLSAKQLQLLEHVKTAIAKATGEKESVL